MGMLLYTVFCIFITQGLLENAVAALTKMDRTVKSIMGDGNCLFHALAYIIYGEEVVHEKMRELLANFISQNCEHMQPYIDGDVREYVAKVKLT